MKLKHKAMIVGGAVLFAVPACDDGGGDDPMDLGAIPRDAMSDSSPNDANPSDSSSGDQGVVVPDMAGMPDGAQLDMSDGMDSAVSPDASSVDMMVNLPDVAVLDAATPMDMAIVEPQDAAVMPDEGPPPGACADQLGQPCERFGIGCCENERPVLMCQGGVFVNHADDGLPCHCDMANGVTNVACAVPGFVGIHLAGRVRSRAPRLRDLLG